jgi:hypothetical protein
MPGDLALRVAALNEAVLSGRFDSARLCLALIQKKIGGTGLELLQAAMQSLAAVLGPAGSLPEPGLGRALVDVTVAMEALFKPEV